MITAAASAAQLTEANGANGTSKAAVTNGNPPTNGTSGGGQSNGDNNDLPAEIARIVDTVNGVPVYAHGQTGGGSVNGAVF